MKSSLVAEIVKDATIVNTKLYDFYIQELRYVIKTL